MKNICWPCITFLVAIIYVGILVIIADSFGLSRNLTLGLAALGSGLVMIIGILLDIRYDS